MIKVLTITFNGMPIIIECVESIIENLKLLENCKYEYCVIDNNSTDGTFEALQSCSHQLLLLRNSSNLGYAKTLSNFINQLLQRESSEEYLLLVNQDAILGNGCVKALIDTIKKSKKVLAVQPKILMYDDSELINSLVP